LKYEFEVSIISFEEEHKNSDTFSTYLLSIEVRSKKFMEIVGRY